MDAHLTSKLKIIISDCFASGQIDYGSLTATQWSTTFATTFVNFLKILLSCLHIKALGSVFVMWQTFQLSRLLLKFYSLTWPIIILMLSLFPLLQQVTSKPQSEIIYESSGTKCPVHRGYYYCMTIYCRVLKHLCFNLVCHPC